MKIVIGADHRGFALKEDLKMYLQALNYSVVDVGAKHLDPTDDYPDFAYPAAMLVATADAERGILICGSGAGVTIAANKVAGIRAVEAHSVEHIVTARNDDDANILALSADETDSDTAREIAEAFLNTPFSGDERHQRRLDEIAEIEEDEDKEPMHE